MCSPWHDLTTAPDGRRMCAICFEWQTREELFEDAKGQKWDICGDCAKDEDFTGE
jgi:hypothetical protein